MDTLKILWISQRDWTHPEFGGAETYVREVASRLTNWGHNVTILCERYKGSKENEDNMGVTIIRTGGKYSNRLAICWRYLRQMPGCFDVVVDNIAHGVPFFTPLFSKEPVVAVMYHWHGMVFFSELPFPVAIVGYVSEASIPKLYRKVRWIAISDSTKNELTEGGIPESNINVVYSGIDHGLYKPNGAKSPFPHILFVGHLTRYKRVEHLIVAMKYVIKQLPNAKLSLVGWHRDRYLRDLKILVEKLGLKSSITFNGYVDDQTKVDLMQKAWVFVNPSMKEGWGITVIEANACGTPAVVSHVGGLRDSVIDGENGYLVPYGRPEALAKCLISLLRDQDLRERLSKNAIRWAERFNWDETARGVLRVCRTATRGRESNCRL